MLSLQVFPANIRLVANSACQKWDTGLMLQTSEQWLF